MSAMPHLLLVSQDQGIMAFLIGMLITFLIFGAIVYVFSAIVTKKLLEKAGQEGWPAWVPIYNVWRLFEISGKPGALSLILLASVIPFLGYLAILAVGIMLGIFVGKAFGKETGFIVGLILLGIVFYPILAFGDSKYVGASAAAEGFPVGPPR